MYDLFSPKASEEMIKEAFDLLDQQKTGSISAEQTLFVCRALGFAPTGKQADALTKAIGQNLVDYPKLKKFYADIPSDIKQPHELEQGMRNAFQALDSNGNGKLQETELRHILRNLGDMLKGEDVSLTFCCC